MLENKNATIKNKTVLKNDILKYFLHYLKKTNIVASQCTNIR